MISLEKLISSQAVRQQCIKENRVFNLWEQATLVWNNPDLPNCERLDLLREVLNQTKTESQWDELCSQIKERIDSQLLLEKRFYDYEDKQYFTIEHRNNSNKHLAKNSHHYSELNDVFDYVQKGLIKHCLNGEFKVHKSYIDSDSERDIVAEFNRRNELIDIYEYPDRDFFWDKARFESSFLSLPFPFRDGDFVRTKGCDEVGIFRGCKDEAEYQKTMDFQANLIKKGIADYSDVSCTAEYLEPSYKNPSQLVFSHSHPYLMNLEFAEVKESDSNYEIMIQAQALLKGRGSLELFCVAILKE